MESAAEQFEEATANAQDSARRAAAVTKSALGNALYKTCYGVSYGLVFGAVFVTEMLPEGNTIRRGFVEGAEAAIGNRKKAVEKKSLKAPKTAEPKAKRSGKSSSRSKKAVNERADDFAAQVN